jgi:hypothetical protein
MHAVAGLTARRDEIGMRSHDVKPDAVEVHAEGKLDDPDDADCACEFRCLTAGDVSGQPDAGSRRPTALELTQTIDEAQNVSAKVYGSPSV